MFLERVKARTNSIKRCFKFGSHNKAQFKKDFSFLVFLENEKNAELHFCHFK